MLTRSFSNLSLQSGISAFIVVLGFSIWASLSFDFENITTGLIDFSWLSNQGLLRPLVIISFPFISLIYNSLFNRLGILQSAYHIMILCGIQLLLFYLYSPGVEIILMLWLSLLIYQKIFSLNSMADPRAQIFSIGNLIGLCALIVPESLFLLLLLWCSFFVYRFIYIKFFIISLMGIFGIYFLIYSASYFFFDYDFIAFLKSSFLEIQFDIEHYDLRKPLWLIPFLISLLWSAYELVANIGKATVYKRQILTLCLTLITCLFAIAPTLKQSELLLTLAVFPLCVLQGNLVLNLKKWWMKDLVYLLILAGLLLQLF